jgi:hypothetical protein
VDLKEFNTWLKGYVEGAGLQRMTVGDWKYVLKKLDEEANRPPQPVVIPIGGMNWGGPVPNGGVVDCGIPLKIHEPGKPTDGPYIEGPFGPDAPR